MKNITIKKQVDVFFDEKKFRGREGRLPIPGLGSTKVSLTTYIGGLSFFFWFL